MTVWVCRTCAVEQPDTARRATACPICQDDRQYVPPTGQRWMTLAELAGGRAALKEALDRVGAC